MVSLVVCCALAGFRHMDAARISLQCAAGIPERGLGRAANPVYRGNVWKLRPYAPVAILESCDHPGTHLVVSAPGSAFGNDPQCLVAIGILRLEPCSDVLQRFPGGAESTLGRPADRKPLG